MKSEFDSERLKQAFTFYCGIWERLGIKEEYRDTLFKFTKEAMEFRGYNFSNWKERGLPFDKDDIELLWISLEEAVERFASRGYVIKENVKKDEAEILRTWKIYKESIRRELDYYVGETSGKVPLMASFKEKALSLPVEAASWLGKHFDLLCKLGYDDVIVLGILVSGSSISAHTLTEALRCAEKRPSTELLETMMNTPALLKELAAWQEIRNSEGVALSGNKVPEEIWEKKFFRKANALDTHTLHLLLTAVEYIWPDERGTFNLGPAQVDQLLLFKYALTAKGKYDVIIAASPMYGIEIC